MRITPIAAASLIPATVAGIAFTIMPFATAVPAAAAPHASHSPAPAHRAIVRHAAAPASSHQAAAKPAPAPAPAAAPATPQRPASTGEDATASQPLTAGMSAFEKCVAWRESTNNPTASSAGLFGILPATWHQLGYQGTAGQASVALQKAAFARLYAELGTQPWAPYDGC